MEFIKTVLASLIGCFIAEFLYEVYWDSKHPVQIPHEFIMKKEDLEKIFKKGNDNK